MRRQRRERAGENEQDQEHETVGANECPECDSRMLVEDAAGAVTIRELAEIIQSIVDGDPEIVHTDPREGDIDRSRAEIERAKRTLGYEPTVQLETGLRRLLADEV